MVNACLLFLFETRKKKKREDCQTGTVFSHTLFSLFASDYVFTLLPESGRALRRASGHWVPFWVSRRTDAGLYTPPRAAASTAGRTVSSTWETATSLMPGSGPTNCGTFLSQMSPTYGRIFTFHRSTPNAC